MKAVLDDSAARTTVSEAFQKKQKGCDNDFYNFFQNNYSIDFISILLWFKKKEKNKYAVQYRYSLSYIELYIRQVELGKKRVSFGWLICVRFFDMKNND